MERALDGVLGGLVAQHGHRRVDVGATAGLHRDVEELPADHLGAAVVEHLEGGHHALGRQAAPAQQLVGPEQQQVAEEDGRGGAVLLRVSAPRPRPVCGREGAVRGRAAAAGVGGVHVVVVDQRAGVQHLQRGAAHATGRPRRPPRATPPGSPTSRTRPGSACRRTRSAGPPRAGPRRRGRAERPARPSRRGTRRGSSAAAPGRPSPPVTRPTTSWFEASGPLASLDLPPMVPGQHDSASSIGQLVREGERSISFEFMPPKDDAGVEQLWSAIRDLEPYQPDVRVGDLRRRRHHPRHHRRHHRPHRPRDLAAGHGPPDLCRPHPRGAARHPGVLPRRRRPRRARAARRPEGGPAAPTGRPLPAA